MLQAVARRLVCYFYIINPMTFDSLNDDEHLYFITASICGWKPLFKSNTYSSIIIEALDTRRRQKKIFLFAFVIMPTHLHCILKPINQTIGQTLQNFGSYTAHRIIHQLEHDNEEDLLTFFHESRRESDIRYSIWQDIQAKNIYSMEFLEQKLEYVHNNPVMKHWNLVISRESFPFSSAGYYDLGITPKIVVDNIWDYLDKPNH